MIDLTLLYASKVDKIDLDGNYEIPKELFCNSEIIDLSTIEVSGLIENKNETFFINANIKGRMKINDSVTLDEIWYPFNIKLDDKLEEFVENNKNYLDIIEFLWQNIVMEVPLRYTQVKNYDEYQGDGWKLVSEEELDSDNPFSTLLENEDWSD